MPPRGHTEGPRLTSCSKRRATKTLPPLQTLERRRRPTHSIGRQAAVAADGEGRRACTAIRFSYSDRIWPVVNAVSSGSRSEVDGRLPVNVLCGMSESGTFSARSSTGVLPVASASACAKKLHMSSSWLDTTSPCAARAASRPSTGACDLPKPYPL